MSSRTPALRVVGQALWLGPALACVSLIILGTVISATDHDPDFGTGLAGGFWVTLVSAPVWLPLVVALSGLAGLAASGIVGAPTRPARCAAVLGGFGLAGAVAALTYTLAWHRIGWTLASAAWVAVVGVGAVLLARRRDGTDLRLSPAGRIAAWWGLGFALAAICTWIGAVVLRVSTGLISDGDATCASQSDDPGWQAVYAQTSFPPQAWCLSGDVADPWVPLWTGPALVCGLTLTLLLGLMALYWHGRDHDVRIPHQQAAGVVTAVLLLGLVAAALVSDPKPPADAVARAHALTSPSSSPTEPSSRSSGTEIPTTPATSAPTSLAPAVPAAAVRDDMSGLQRIAEQTGGPELLWPSPLAVTEAPCTDTSGTSGTLVTLTGMFTTRDLDTATDNVDFLEITQANEQVAEQIVDAWTASGLVAGVADKMHGEWYTGGGDRGTIDLAHVGFTDGVGDIRVTGRCATYA
ncbi:hypothetical protein GCM10009785_04750 [Brooklawnia cerclae]|uniref:Uncharacterized protein n=1 Tax=Brooklawnia cerclae TaxID=349934 RepID=A0ABX0SDH1_9ACTN|nr:hypothetical protein [Brooklawnia cerclae]NIH55934.1 hypothetical protein [Brooklawnia cerclae]